MFYSITQGNKVFLRDAFYSVKTLVNTGCMYVINRHFNPFPDIKEQLQDALKMLYQHLIKAMHINQDTLGF